MYGNDMVGCSDAELHLRLAPRNLGDVALDESFRPSYTLVCHLCAQQYSIIHKRLALSRPVCPSPARKRSLSVYLSIVYTGLGSSTRLW